MAKSFNTLCYIHFKMALGLIFIKVINFRLYNIYIPCFIIFNSMINVKFLLIIKDFVAIRTHKNYYLNKGLNAESSIIN